MELRQTMKCVLSKNRKRKKKFHFVLFHDFFFCHFCVDTFKVGDDGAVMMLPDLDIDVEYDTPILSVQWVRNTKAAALMTLLRNTVVVTWPTWQLPPADWVTYRLEVSEEITCGIWLDRLCLPWDYCRIFFALADCATQLLCSE